MKDKSAEELIIRWMDGEDVTSEEEAQLKAIHAADPSKIIPPKEYSAIRNELKAVFPTDLQVPNKERFQSTLLDRIEKEGGREVIKTTAAASAKPLSATPQKSPNDIKVTAPQQASNVEQLSTAQSQKGKKANWLLALAGMAACFLIGLLININTSKAPQGITGTTIDHSQIQPVFYSPNDGITADYLTKGETNVIIIQGLDAIPDDVDLFSLVEEAAPKRTPIKVYPNITYPKYEN